jgi:hypothetical protein
MSVEQVAPGAAQMPQLGLQQTWPVLQSALPQRSLVGNWAALAHVFWSQVAPGAAQMPQLGLQQT